MDPVGDLDMKCAKKIEKVRKMDEVGEIFIKKMYICEQIFMLCKIGSSYILENKK